MCLPELTYFLLYSKLTVWQDYNHPKTTRCTRLESLQYVVCSALQRMMLQTNSVIWEHTVQKNLDCWCHWPRLTFLQRLWYLVFINLVSSEVCSVSGLGGCLVAVVDFLPVLCTFPVLLLLCRIVCNRLPYVCGLSTVLIQPLNTLLPFLLPTHTKKGGNFR